MSVARAILLTLTALATLAALLELARMPADPTSASTGKLHFPETHVRLGEVAAGQRATFVYRFTNEGPGRVVLAEVASSCNCLQTLVDRLEFAPGERGLVRCTFDSTGWEGLVEKTVTVKTFGGNTSLLTMRAEVQR